MRKLICGKNSVRDAVESGLPILSIHSVFKPDFEMKENIPVFLKTRKELDKMTELNHQGIIAEIESMNYYSVDELLNDNPSKVLILDHIQDPHNFGAIIRTANAAGVKHIIIPKDRAAQLTDTVMKISSGGFVGMKVIKVSSLSSTITKLKERGFWVYTTAIENGSDINKVSFNFPMVLIVGNEGKGVSKPLLKMSDQNVYIKMDGTVQSMNVSVATGVALFKILENEQK